MMIYREWVAQEQKANELVEYWYELGIGSSIGFCNKKLPTQTGCWLYISWNFSDPKGTIKRERSSGVVKGDMSSRFSLETRVRFLRRFSIVKISSKQPTVTNAASYNRS